MFLAGVGEAGCNITEGKQKEGFHRFQGLFVSVFFGWAHCFPMDIGRVVVHVLG